MTIVIYLVNFFLAIDTRVVNNNLLESIGSRVVEILKKERTKQGVSMTRFAEQAGLSQSMISLSERGLRKPTLDTLLRISFVLEIDLAKVLRKAIDHSKN